MPFCKEKNSRLERKAQGNKAMDKLNKRIQVLYKSSLHDCELEHKTGIIAI